MGTPKPRKRVMVFISLKTANIYMLYSRRSTHVTHHWRTIMTVIMTIVGVVVFILTLFTKTFKVALKRLWVLALTGVVIDMLIIGISLTVTTVALY